MNLNIDSMLSNRPVLKISEGSIITNPSNTIVCVLEYELDALFILNGDMLNELQIARMWDYHMPIVLCIKFSNNDGHQNLFGFIYKMYTNHFIELVSRFKGFIQQSIKICSHPFKHGFTIYKPKYNTYMLSIKYPILPSDCDNKEAMNIFDRDLYSFHYPSFIECLENTIGLIFESLCTVMISGDVPIYVNEYLTIDGPVKVYIRQAAYNGYKLSVYDHHSIGSYIIHSGYPCKQRGLIDSLTKFLSTISYSIFDDMIITSYYDIDVRFSL